MTLPLMFAGLYGASIVAFFVTSRYRAPLLPVYALGTGLLAVHLVDCARDRHWRAAVLASAFAGALLILLNLNPFGYQDDPGQGHLVLGISYEGSGRIDRAIEEYGRAASIPGPYSYEALHRKGEALAAAGRCEPACEALRDSVRLRPDNAVAISAWLRTAVACGTYPEARGAALKLDVGDDAGRANLLFAVGSMDQALGQTGVAELEYREVLRLRADHLGARLNLALLLRNTGRLDESLAQLLEAERLNPASGAVQLNLAKHDLFLGDRAAAERHMSRARDLGEAIPPDFLAALEGREPSRGIMTTGTPDESTGVRERENAGSSKRP
jgi:tetratricopeptide (TPR) repeat protein